MSIPHITTLLEFCLKNTYFLFQGKYYEQVQGAAMGSPHQTLSLPTCLRKSLRSKPLAQPHTPHLWLRFVDDIYVIRKAEHSQLSSTAPQHTGPSCTVHSGGNQPRWITSIS